MRWWRITDPAFAKDKTGYGMSLYGGRWNSAGVPAIYAASTVELAALEKWVHLSGTLPAMIFALVAIDIPDDTSLIEPLHRKKLPRGWSELPSSPAAMKYGDQRLQPHGPLGFIVPSAVVDESLNIVLNPRHSAIVKVKFTVQRDFMFDARMRK